MTVKTQSSRRVRRPLIKAVKGMLAMTFLGCGSRLGPQCTNDNLYCDDPGSGGGGSGGTAGSSSTGDAGNGGIGGMGEGGAGGGGGSAECVNTCIEVATDNTLTPCAGSDAEKLWTALMTCVCMTTGVDGCADVCQDNRCLGMPSTADCDKCLNQGACSDELATCSTN